MSEINEKVIIITILGLYDSGKKDILDHYFHNEFKEINPYTIGPVFQTKYFKFDGVKVKANYFDFVGQEKSRSISVNYLKGTHGIIFVFDITNKDTFDYLETCLKDLKEQKKTDVSKVLIGNKSHLDDNREVKVEDAQNLADKLKCKYFEVSTETGENIAEAFEEITRAAYNIYINNESIFNPIMLNKEKEKKKKNC